MAVREVAARRRQDGRFDMELTGTTWIVTADAAEARFFAEPQRAGPVHELAKLHMHAGHEDHAPGRQQVTVHERAGSGRHGAGGGASPKVEAEERFLKRLAERLAQAAQHKEFDRLVLMAPPQALGLLKHALSPAVAERLEATEPHERVRDGAEEIRRHLRDVRARA
jgi:protein required for attachment to host cells